MANRKQFSEGDTAFFVDASGKTYRGRIDAVDQVKGGVMLRFANRYLPAPSCGRTEAEAKELAHQRAEFLATIDWN